MFCPNCGKEIGSQIAFCGFCGAKINDIHSDSQSPTVDDTIGIRKQVRWTWIVLVIVLALAALSSAYLFLLRPIIEKKNITWQEQYDLGIRYLDSDEYEKAIVAFETALEIDPKSVDTYIALADAYSAQGQADHALEVLDTAEKAVDDQRLDDKRQEIQKTYTKDEEITDAVQDNKTALQKEKNYTRLAELRVFYNGTLNITKQYQYDEDGVYPSSIQQINGQGNDDITVYTNSYDNADRLLKQSIRNSSGNTWDSVELTYDDEGHILSETHSYEDGYSNVQNALDDQGRIIKQIIEYTSYDGSSSTSELIYDYQGNQTIIRGDDGSYQSRDYDEDGNLVRADMNGVYVDYTYLTDNIVLGSDSNGTEYLYILDSNSSGIETISLGEFPVLNYNDMGLLCSAEYNQYGTEYRLEFDYDVSSDSPSVFGLNGSQSASDSNDKLSVYIPVVENALHSDLEYIHNETAPGMLYDIDQDGILELLLLYGDDVERSDGNLFSCIVCDIYSVKDGKLQPRLEQLPIEEMMVAPYASVSIAEFEGKRYVLIYHKNYESPNYWEYYTLYDCKTLDTVLTYYGYYDYLNNEESEWTIAEEPVLSCEKNGETCSLEEYLEFVDSLIIIDEMIYCDEIREYGDNGMSLENMLSYLQAKSKDDSGDSKLTEISDNNWEDFLESKDYLDYIDPQILKQPDPKLKYALYDLDDDGNSELIISADGGAPFYFTWLFKLDNGKAHMVCDVYGYGGFAFSPRYNAVLVSPETRPNASYSGQEFYKLKGYELEYLFTVSTEMGEYYYYDSVGRNEISEAERDAYFSDTIDFEWTNID